MPSQREKNDIGFPRIALLLVGLSVGIFPPSRAAVAATPPPPPTQYFRETWDNTTALPRALVNDNMGRNFTLASSEAGTDNTWHVLFPPLAMGTWNIGMAGDPMASAALIHAAAPSGLPLSENSDAGYFRSMLAAPLAVSDHWRYTIHFKHYFLSVGTTNMPRLYVYLAADGGEATGDAGRPVNGFGAMTFGRTVRPYPESFGALAVGSSETWIPCPEEDFTALAGVLYEWTVSFTRDKTYTLVEYDIKRGGENYRSGITFVANKIAEGAALDRVVLMTRNRALVALDEITITAGPRTGDEPPPPGAPEAVPTFHSLGLYWSPPGAGEAHPFASVRYREAGTSGWRDALPMRYMPIAGTDEDKAPYRGSIVNLKPDTAYEIALALDGADDAASLTARTWSEHFPVGTAIPVESRNIPLNIIESGTPDAYRLYDGTGATIDVQHAYNNCITVNAQYVILRGFKLRGAGINDTVTGGNGAAIRITAGRNIVIEDCDISDWGRPHPTPLMENHGRNMDAAVYSNDTGVSQVIIQRCRMHHPTYDTNHWEEPVPNTHPAGPQCVVFINNEGNHVIRYNEFYSDDDHRYNDILGGGSNGSFRGYPGPDSDIYCNYLSHCWDDAIEIEGSNRNVRVWNNYITDAYSPIGNAPTSIGPLYLWRNVSNRSERLPGGGAGRFIKMGFATSEDWMTGHQYIFHNTIFQENLMGCSLGIGATNRIMRHTTTRNNVLQLRSAGGVSISSTLRTTDNSFDYDLFNGAVPSGHEAHGIQGEPVYISGAGFDPLAMQGRFQLSRSSPGYDAGEIIPNFSDGWLGAAPDMGAHENGWKPMQFGVRAVFQPGEAEPPASVRYATRLYP